MSSQKNQPLTCQYCKRPLHIQNEDIRHMRIESNKVIQCLYEDCKSHENDGIALIILNEKKSLKSLKQTTKDNQLLSLVDLGDEYDEYDESLVPEVDDSINIEDVKLE